MQACDQGQEPARTLLEWQQMTDVRLVFIYEQCILVKSCTNGRAVDIRYTVHCSLQNTQLIL